MSAGLPSSAKSPLDGRPLLQVQDLKVHFHAPEGVIEAVKGVSFEIPAGGTVALVGESGSGKSVVAQTIMGILPKTAKIASDPSR